MKNCSSKNKVNLNAYLFANLLIVGILLVSLWNRKPVWDVSLRFPNLLLILVLINTVLIFRDVIFAAAATPRIKRAAKLRKRSLNELRAVLKNASRVDESLLISVLERLKNMAKAEAVTVFITGNGQSKQLASAGDLPPALVGCRFTLKSDVLFIKYTGNLGEEEAGKLTTGNRPLIFKSSITRLEMTAVPLALASDKTGICIFSSRENHKSPPVSLASLALFLETLMALIDASQNAGDARYKDKETGLLLFSCFNDSFETEVERSERYKQEMSLLSLSIAGFENLQEADKLTAAKSTAVALKQSLRRLDLMFCGETEGHFLAILTETGIETAEIVAARIQKTFAKQTEKVDFISSHKIVIQIGSATYPIDATHGMGLLEKSLESLAGAKETKTGFKAYSDKPKD